MDSEGSMAFSPRTQCQRSDLRLYCFCRSGGLPGGAKRLGVDSSLAGSNRAVSAGKAIRNAREQGRRSPPPSLRSAARCVARGVSGRGGCSGCGADGRAQQRPPPGHPEVDDLPAVRPGQMQQCAVRVHGHWVPTSCNRPGRSCCPSRRRSATGRCPAGRPALSPGGPSPPGCTAPLPDGRCRRRPRPPRGSR